MAKWIRNELNLNLNKCTLIELQNETIASSINNNNNNINNINNKILKEMM